MGADHTLQLMLDANTNVLTAMYVPPPAPHPDAADSGSAAPAQDAEAAVQQGTCLLYTSPSPRDKRQSRMPSSA